MNQTIADKKLVAYCGLYCGSCKSYKNNRCPGCGKNEKAAWCKIRSCCIENNHNSCANCMTHTDPNTCRYFNNFMSKIFAFIFKSDRKACIEKIRAEGYEKYAQQMAESGLQSIKKEKNR
ncbi:MAG: DUF3795 domain-containing protein [Fibrobacter sp.]|nr:DUF3795 domain-containing protein [Fibrobacter sp.]